MRYSRYYFKIRHMILIITFLSAFLVIPNANAIKNNNQVKTNDQIELEKLVNRLIADHYYNEAVSLMENRLQTQVNRPFRFYLLTNLTEVHNKTGNYALAAEYLSQAESIALAPQEQQVIIKLKRSLPSNSAEEKSDVDPTVYEDTLLETQNSSMSDINEESFLISNSFFEIDLRQVLTDLSMESGIPIIWDKTVQGLVTYEAIDQELEDVLNAILTPAGYAYKYDGNIYIVGSSNPSDPAFELLSETKLIYLANIESSEAIGLLSDFFKPYVKSSKSTNAVCITAPASIISRIEADLAQIDEPVQQILIDVVVTEITTSALRQMGLDWSLTRSSGNPSWNVQTDHTDLGTKAISASYADMAFDLGDYTGELLGSLEALVQSGEAKIRANPRITTVNGNKAEIGITKDQYFIIQTSTSQTYQYNTLQSISSGIKLEITPYISGDNSITIRVKPEVGDVIGSGKDGLPEISSRTANTVVRVKDGETSTIGGLNIQTEKVSQNKIPLLGSIPILGYLFRYDEREVRDTQIIIFITPHLVN
ncbi:MAG: hypothetical protein GF315_04700 [candidate division Zixibacteria bacterium]|nr:hypothetical protein [candidate division Zixibacteria bacterium]